MATTQVTAPAYAVVFGTAGATDTNTNVTLTLIQGGNDVAKTATDGAGNYRFDRVAPGHYTLRMDSVGTPASERCATTTSAGQRPQCLVGPATSDQRDIDLTPGEQLREDF